MEGEMLGCLVFFFSPKKQDDKVEVGRDADQALQETQYTIFSSPKTEPGQHQGLWLSQHKKREKKKKEVRDEVRNCSTKKTSSPGSMAVSSTIA